MAVWDWSVVLSLALGIASIAVTVGNNFHVSIWTFVLLVPAIVLIVVRLIHREPKPQNDPWGRQGKQAGMSRGL